MSLTFDILGWYTPATIYFSQDVSLCMATPIIVILLHCQWFMCKLDFICSSLSILPIRHVNINFLFFPVQPIQFSLLYAWLMHPIITAQAKVIRTDPSNKLLFVLYAYNLTTNSSACHNIDFTTTS